jgi:hypothetical protein
MNEFFILIVEDLLHEPEAIIKMIEILVFLWRVVLIFSKWALSMYKARNSIV